MATAVNTRTTPAPRRTRPESAAARHQGRAFHPVQEERGDHRQHQEPRRAASVMTGEGAGDGMRKVRPAACQPGALPGPRRPAAPTRTTESFHSSRRSTKGSRTSGRVRVPVRGMGATPLPAISWTNLRVCAGVIRMLRARHAGKANESGRSSDSSRVRHPSRFRHPLALLLERGVISPVVELTEYLLYIGRLVVDSSPSFPNIQNLEAPRHTDVCRQQPARTIGSSAGDTSLHPRSPEQLL